MQEKNPSASANLQRVEPEGLIGFIHFCLLILVIIYFDYAVHTYFLSALQEMEFCL